MKQPQNQGKSTELYKFFIAVNQPSLYRKKTACLDTDSRRRFSETLRTFTKTLNLGMTFLTLHGFWKVLFAKAKQNVTVLRTEG